MQLTIHRGAKEIGGSCVELAAGNTRIVLDVGMPLFDAHREPFDTKQLRGKSNSRLLTAGILPNVPGLFARGDKPDAILLSHAHLDHVGLLKYSREDIPVYASKGTSKMMLAGSVFSGQTRIPEDRFREVKSGKKFKIGAFTITPYAVDHSTFDALAFLVEADGKSLLYSGDLRMHGRKPGMHKELIKAVAPRNVDILLMEGTHLGGDKERGLSEKGLETELVKIVKGAPGVVLACFSPMDVDRLVTYYRVAKRTNRIFVADVYAAFVLHLVSGQAKIPPPVKSENIRVYYNQYFDLHYGRKKQGKIHLMFSADRIGMDEILAAPKRHLMVFRPSMSKLDFDDHLPEKCRCVYSYWLGYLEKKDWIDLKAKVKVAGGDFIPAHASGHIYVPDWIDFVRAIGAKKVVPIHTFEGGRFGEYFGNTCNLLDGQRLFIE